MGATIHKAFLKHGDPALTYPPGPGPVLSLPKGAPRSPA